MVHVICTIIYGLYTMRSSLSDPCYALLCEMDIRLTQSTSLASPQPDHLSILLKFGEELISLLDHVLVSGKH